MPGHRSNSRTKLKLLTALLLPVVLILVGGCSGDSESGGSGRPQLIPAVEVVRAKFGSLPLSERLNGLVKAKNQVELYPQVSAQIQKVLVENGDRVKDGQVLIQLNDTELREQLKQAEASLQIASAQAKQALAEQKRIKNELSRSTDLANKNLISDTEYERIETNAIAAEADADLAQARVEQAQAEVDEKKEALSKTVIRAPIAGTVGNRNAEVGMVVNTNTKLFTIGQLDSLRVEVVLTDRMLNYIREKQRTEISSPNLPFGQIEAPLSRISPFLHPLSHSTKAEIDVTNVDNALNSGMFVTVDIFYGESEAATLVPLSALWENPSTATTGVFVCRDSLKGEPGSQLDNGSNGSLSNPVSFEFVPVDIIARGRMSAGVHGLEPGDWVVTIGQDLLGSDSAQARARTVNWERVENLQNLQREDLLEEIIKRQESGKTDTALIGMAVEIKTRI